MKRVIIFRNGQTNNGKAILIPETFDTLLSIASCKFNCVAKILFTSKGGEIDDIDVIKDDEVLYVSCGESFMSPADLQTVDCSDDSEWVTLNVGGKRFTTTRSTLTKKEPDSMLARMFARDEGAITWSSSRDKKGAFLIDRSPTYFEPILNYLRHGEIIADKNTCLVGVLEEAKFFGLDAMIEQLELMIREDEPISDNVSLSRQDVIRALIVTSSICELRFQGVNLAGADLSKLDLRYINFKHANLQRTNLVGANLSFCYLERADLSHAILDGAHILGVKMLCANLEGASLRNCNFEDPAGSRANMEGVNLKGVNMEGSQMAGVNLRVATLKNANLQNCDLRGAVLAGADLENCDLSGSDLHEANLRGANLKGAAFELMLTPLHMSQTIR